MRYWVEQLGFRREFSWGDPMTFAGVTRDGIEVMFCQDGQGHAGTWMTIWVDDVDVLFDELRRAPRTSGARPWTCPGACAR